nr:hypothetical protein [Desulfuromonadales bacterium]
NPALGKAFFDAIKSSYSEDFAREQLNAEIVAKSGAVYAKTFKQEPFKPKYPGASGNMIPWTPRRDPTL